MNLFSLTGHALNFCLPALWTAACAVLFGGLVLPAGKSRWPRRLACDFAVGLGVLAAGLLVTGSDGKMATWAALIVSVSLCECLLRGGWRR